MQKAITVSVSSIALLFFLLNTNFYPQLLSYQGGKPLADLTKEKINPKDVYFWKNTYSSSYNFYSASLRQVYNDSLRYGNKKTWIIYSAIQLPELEMAGIVLSKEKIAVPDYEITRLKKSFIDPATRTNVLDSIILAEVVGHK
jgi:hypothetical protein